jgi:hypothetical protein
VDPRFGFPERRIHMDDPNDDMRRTLGRIEGRLDGLGDLAARVTALEHWLHWLKGGWAVMASVLTYLLKAAYGK